MNQREQLIDRMIAEWHQIQDWDRDDTRNVWEVAADVALTVFEEEHAKDLATSPGRVKDQADSCNVEGANVSDPGKADIPPVGMTDNALYPDPENRDKTGNAPTDDEKRGALADVIENAKTPMGGTLLGSRVQFEAVADVVLAAGYSKDFRVDESSPSDDEREVLAEQGEPEWEYGISYNYGFEEFEGQDLLTIERRVKEIRRQGGYYARTVHALRRRPAGESEPVEENTEALTDGSER